MSALSHAVIFHLVLEVVNVEVLDIISDFRYILGSIFGQSSISLRCWLGFRATLLSGFLRSLCMLIRTSAVLRTVCDVALWGRGEVSFSALLRARLRASVKALLGKRGICKLNKTPLL